MGGAVALRTARSFALCGGGSCQVTFPDLGCGKVGFVVMMVVVVVVVSKW